MQRVSRLSVALLCLVLSLSFSAAAKEKIEVWLGHDSWIPYVMRFNEVQDEYEAEWILQSSKDALIAAVVAGTPPDVFRSAGMLDLATRGVLQPLDPFIERDGVDLDAFIPGILKSLQWEGKTYALPLNGDSNLLFYNIDLFEAAGLDASAAPRTWAELEATARRLNREDGNGNLRQVGFSWWALGNQFLMFLHQKLDSMFDDSLTDVAFDAPEALEVIEWIVDNQNEINGGHGRVQALMQNYDNSWYNVFSLGGMAMNTNVPAMMARIETNNPDMRYGVVPLPLADGGRRVNVSGGHRVTIPVGAKNPEGAWAFIKWLTSFEAGMEFAEVGFTQRYIDRPYMGIGQSMSARIDVNLEAPFYRETPVWRDFAQDMIYAIDYPVHPLHERFSTLLQNNVLAVLNGAMGPGEAVEAAARQARAELNEWIQLQASQ